MPGERTAPHLLTRSAVIRPPHWITLPPLPVCAPRLSGPVEDGQTEPLRYIFKFNRHSPARPPRLLHPPDWLSFWTRLSSAVADLCCALYRMCSAESGRYILTITQGADTIIIRCANNKYNKHWSLTTFTFVLACTQEWHKI